MSRSAPDAPRYAWPLAALAILPYAASSIAVWAAPGAPAHLAPWLLGLYAAALIGATGIWRLVVVLGQGRPVSGSVLILAVLTPSLAILACAAAPWISFRWTFTLLVAALSVQSLADVGGPAMPSFFRQIRAAVSAAGLICLLIGMLGA